MQRGRPHYFPERMGWRHGIQVEFRPGQQHLLFFSNFARMTAGHPEWFSAKGDPDFLLIAAGLHRFPRTHTHLARPPVLIQKLLFRALVAPISKLTGYTFEEKPVHFAG